MVQIEENSIEVFPERSEQVVNVGKVAILLILKENWEFDLTPNG